MTEPAFTRQRARQMAVLGRGGYRADGFNKKD